MLSHEQMAHFPCEMTGKGSQLLGLSTNSVPEMSCWKLGCMVIGSVGDNQSQWAKPPSYYCIRWSSFMELRPLPKTSKGGTWLFSLGGWGGSLWLPGTVFWAHGLSGRHRVHAYCTRGNLVLAGWLDVPLEVRINGDRISGLFHPNILYPIYK